MDPTNRPPFTNQPPPPPPSTSSYASFPILAITILEIPTTAILLVIYHVFTSSAPSTSACADLVHRLYSAKSRRRHFQMPSVIHTATATKLRVLEPSAIHSIPIIKFTKAGGGAEVHWKTSLNECAVCLNEFQEEETLMLLPSCSHAFHIGCIDICLQVNANFPLLNGSIAVEVIGDENSAQTLRT